MPHPLDSIRGMATWTICVADLEVSVRFYCEGLGFTEGRPHAIDIAPGSELSKAYDLPEGGKIRGRFISRPDVKFLLICFDEPGAVGGRDRKPTNQIGPRSMIFTCSSPKALAIHLETLGGKMVHEKDNGTFDAVLVIDPDGFSLQLEDLPSSTFETAFQQ